MYMYTTDVNVHAHVHVHCVYCMQIMLCVYLFAYMDNEINTRPGNTLTVDKNGGRHATLQS